MKLLVTAPAPERWLVEVRPAFPEVDFVVGGTPADEAGEIADADAVFGHLGRDAFLAARRLRWIQCHGAGVEWMHAIPELVGSDVVVTNTRGAHAATIAEHTMGMLVFLARGFGVLYAAQGRRAWLRPADVP